MNKRDHSYLRAFSGGSMLVLSGILSTIAFGSGCEPIVVGDPVEAAGTGGSPESDEDNEKKDSGGGGADEKKDDNAETDTDSEMSMGGANGDPDDNPLAGCVMTSAEIGSLSYYCGVAWECEDGSSVDAWCESDDGGWSCGSDEFRDQGEIRLGPDTPSSYACHTAVDRYAGGDIEKTAPLTGCELYTLQTREDSCESRWRCDEEDFEETEMTKCELRGEVWDCTHHGRSFQFDDVEDSVEACSRTVELVEKQATETPDPLAGCTRTEFEKESYSCDSYWSCADGSKISSNCELIDDGWLCDVGGRQVVLEGLDPSWKEACTPAVYAAQDVPLLDWSAQECETTASSRDEQSCSTTRQCKTTGQVVNLPFDFFSVEDDIPYSSVDDENVDCSQKEDGSWKCECDSAAPFSTNLGFSMHEDSISGDDVCEQALDVCRNELEVRDQVETTDGWTCYEDLEKMTTDFCTSNISCERFDGFEDKDDDGVHDFVEQVAAGVDCEKDPRQACTPNAPARDQTVWRLSLTTRSLCRRHPRPARWRKSCAQRRSWIAP